VQGLVRGTSPSTSTEQMQAAIAAIMASGDLVYTWDLATDRIDWIGRVGQVFGTKGAPAPQSGDHFNGRINPEDLPLRMQALSEHFTGVRSYDCEYRVRSSDGSFHWVHDRGGVEFSASGTPERLSGTLRVVNQRRQVQAQLEFLANYDELTGHYNKLRLRESLDHALAYSVRYAQNGAFLAVGLDQLDRINAAYGYEVGDTMLVEVANRLDRCLRTTDVIGRLGGDRFGILLHACGEQDPIVIGERILQCIREMPIQAAGEQIHVTASIGAINFPDQSRTSFDVIAKAEGALLKAKAAGRDCLHLYQLSEEQRLSHRANMDLGEEVTRAMKDNRLTFAYQPVVDAKTHQVRFYECLLRMMTPAGEVVPAGKFVPVVERLGMMRALDRCTLNLVLDDLEHNPSVTLAVNISGVTAADRGWLRALVSRLKDRGDMASRLIVEITETAALHDLDDTARFLSVMRDLGCQVAVDDFGAGYTTFRHLKALTVDVVKIDGSFVRNLTANNANRLFIRNLLTLTESYNVITVAECVETEEEAEVLLNEGVHLLQGYYFGKPDLNPAWRRRAIAPPAAEAWPQRKQPLSAG
jgi:diguanylate cyclase (GGDEF)-like protein